MTSRPLAWTAGQVVDIIRYLVLRMMIAGSPRASIAGFQIADLISTGELDARFAKVRDALALIEAVHPSLLRRLQFNLVRIVFLESGPEYWPKAKACILHDVTTHSVAQVALLLVHEGTHARLWRSGVRYAPDTRERVEAICVRAELALLDRLPDETELASYTRQKLSRRWWTDEQRKQRHAEIINDLDAPPWMLRVYRSLMRGKLPRREP